MKLFDSHCHLDDRSYHKDLETVIHRAKQNGIENMMTVSIDQETSIRGIEISDKFKEVYASVGVHPHRASTCSDQVIKRLTDLAKNTRVRAWGETGLDFNRMYSSKDDQEKWFIRQIQTADECPLPLILHERDSQGRLLEILKTHPNKNRCGVVHCFSGNRLELDAYLDLGLFIGITGILTLQKKGVRSSKPGPVYPLGKTAHRNRCTLSDTCPPKEQNPPERTCFCQISPAQTR